MTESNRRDVQQELFEPEMFQRAGEDRWKDYRHLKPLLSGIEPGQGVEGADGSGAAVLREIESRLKDSVAIVLNNTRVLLEPGAGDPEGITKDLYSLVKLTWILGSWQKVKMDELIEEGRKVSAIAEAIRRRFMPRVLVVDDDPNIREILPDAHPLEISEGRDPDGRKQCRGARVARGLRGGSHHDGLQSPRRRWDRSAQEAALDSPGFSRTPGRS